MFYDKVMRLCAKKGISITKLTNILGLSSSVITGWKHGSVPRMSTVKTIADFFRVPPESLLDSEPGYDTGEINAFASTPDGYDKLTDEEKLEINEIIAVYLKRRQLLSGSS